MLLLHLLLVLAAGEESSGLCSQHKHACCCMNVLLLPYSPSCRLPLLGPLLLPRLALLLLLLQPSCFFSGSTALRNTSSCFSVVLLCFSESSKQMRAANKSEKGSPLLPCWICPCPGSCFLFSPALDFLGNRLREKRGRRQGKSRSGSRRTSGSALGLFFGRPTGCLRGPFELLAAAQRPPVEPPSCLADLIEPAS